MTYFRTSHDSKNSVWCALIALALGGCALLGASSAWAIDATVPVVDFASEKTPESGAETCTLIAVNLPERSPNKTDSVAEEPSSIVRGQQSTISSSDALAYLLPLRRNCLPESNCALRIEPPVSAHGELLPLANEFSGLVALKLDEREALCIDDREGKWSKVTGETIPDCPESAHGPHSVKIRLDTAGDGFVASIAFAEFIPTPQHTSPNASQTPMFVPRPARLRLTTTFEEAADVPFAAERMAQGLGNAMGTEEPSVFDVFLKPPTPPSFHFNLKLGNTISSLKGFDFSAFTLKFELEIAYYLRPYLFVFLEVGLSVGNAASDKTSGTSQPTQTASEGDQTTDSDDVSSLEYTKESGSFSLIPVKFGLKFTPFHQYAFRPYIGLGLGLGILSDLVEADSRELTLSFSGNLGIAWIPFNHLGFNLETGLNFDELRVEGGSTLLIGFSVNFGLLVLF